MEYGSFVSIVMLKVHTMSKLHKFAKNIDGIGQCLRIVHARHSELPIEFAETVVDFINFEGQYKTFDQYVWPSISLSCHYSTPNNWFINS